MGTWAGAHAQGPRPDDSGAELWRWRRGGRGIGLRSGGEQFIADPALVGTLAREGRVEHFLTAAQRSNVGDAGAGHLARALGKNGTLRVLDLRVSGAREGGRDPS